MSWASDEAAARREDQRAVGELGFGAGGRGARLVADPELVEQAKRRTFSAAYKARILAEADACTKPGEVGELLRRERKSRSSTGEGGSRVRTSSGPAGK